jgi:hypothetical protein
MKQVQESLYAFKDSQFFNSLFEEDDLSKTMSPADKKKMKEALQRQAMAVVKKCANNFSSFKKNAGDIWQEYRDFWSTQEDAEESVQQKGMFYNMWNSDYIVGVVKQPNGTAALKVLNTSAKDDEYTAFASSNPDAVKAFQEFYNNDFKATIKQIIDSQKTAMTAKKEADAKAEADESKAAKQSQLDAFLSESKRVKSKEKLDEGKRFSLKYRDNDLRSYADSHFSGNLMGGEISAVLDSEYGEEMRDSLLQVRDSDELQQWMVTNFEM